MKILAIAAAALLLASEESHSFAPASLSSRGAGVVSSQPQFSTATDTSASTLNAAANGGSDAAKINALWYAGFVHLHVQIFVGRGCYFLDSQQFFIPASAVGA